MGGLPLTETIKLPARMDVSVAQSLVGDLSGKNFSDGIELDASDVTHFGSLCVQAILVAARAIKEAGGTLTLKNVSEKVEDQLTCMGLTVEDVESGAQ